MSQVFRPNNEAGYCTKCNRGYAIGPHACQMRISYEPQGRCLWHLDCKAGTGSGIMRVVQHEESRSLLECGHCKLRGYYPKGAVGPVCADVVPSSTALTKEAGR